MEGLIGSEHLAGESTISHSFDNVFGGHDTFVNGQKLGYTAPNINGGHNIYGPNGNMVGNTAENIFKGQDIYDSQGGRVAYSQSNAAGGHDLYDANNHLLASSSHNVEGGEDVYSHGQLVSHSYPTAAGIDTVISYADPLAHIGTYVLPPLIFGA